DDGIGGHEAGPAAVQRRERAAKDAPHQAAAPHFSRSQIAHQPFGQPAGARDDDRAPAQRRSLLHEQDSGAGGVGFPGGGEPGRPPAHDRDLHVDVGHPEAARRSAVTTDSGTIGSSSTRAPLASMIALAMAAATGTTGGSPTPFAP